MSQRNRWRAAFRLSLVGGVGPSRLMMGGSVIELGMISAVDFFLVGPGFDGLLG